MPQVEVILKRIARSPALLTVIIYALPSVALIVLGVLWLAEHDWLLPFVGITLGLVVMLRLTLMLLKRLSQKQVSALVATHHAPIVTANPEWTARELAVFNSLCVDRRAIRTPLPG